MGLAQPHVLTFARSWHADGQVDRGLTFMIATGRPDFSEVVWPLITATDRQVRLPALRTGAALSPALLGPRLDTDFASLSDQVRQDLLAELIRWGATEGINKALSLAAKDPSVDVRLEALASCWFVGGSDQVEGLLEKSDEAVWLAFYKRGYGDMLKTPAMVERLARIEATLQQGEHKSSASLRTALRMKDAGARARVITAALVDPAVDLGNDELSRTFAEISKRDPEVVALALRQRIVDGLEVPRGHESLLQLLPAEDAGEIATLVTTGNPQLELVQAAAWLAGPLPIKILLDHCLEAAAHIWANGRPTSDEYEPLRHMKALIEHTRTDPFLNAILEFRNEERPENIKLLADLIVRHRGNGDNQPSISPELSNRVAKITETWASTLLALADVDPSQLSAVTAVMKRYPHKDHVTKLEEMLERYLHLRRGAREAWTRDRRNEIAKQRITHSYNWDFRDAFVAVGTQEAADVLARYVADPDFGEDAAFGLRPSLVAPECAWGQPCDPRAS